MSPTTLQRPFQRLLVANRGEIALRVMDSARRLGLHCIAVYSEADRDGPHVAAADEAVCIGAAAPQASYLNIDAIVDAARRSGADAVHPGYGFLAENEDFAAAVVAAGLVFVGPSAAVIRAMGHKSLAKQHMADAGLPCIPGFQQPGADDAALVAAAPALGLPLMVKAAAGGGGRGMRRVDRLDALPAALAAARSEATAAFGDGDLLLERALVDPRHVELQVLADAHGGVRILGERDCSVQRRHQKLIEEAPSPAVGPGLRARMAEAGTRAVRAIGYVGAGTLEFLLDRDGDFFFMEMNTRLQVEHAVTEAITGLDLVEWQLRVAAGERLDELPDPVPMNGHAIEVRLTAEDVAAGFLPQTGPVQRWRPPAGRGVRVDHALVEGGVVSPHYDSMVAKLVAHGPTRDAARTKLLHALQATVLLGVTTNRNFLADTLAHPAFAAGDVHTGFVERWFDDGARRGPAADADTLAVAAWAMAGAPGADAAASAAPPVLVDLVDLAAPDGGGPGRLHRVRLQAGADHWRVSVGDEAPRVLRALAQGHTVEVDGHARPLAWVRDGRRLHLALAGRDWHFEAPDPRRRRSAGGGDGLLRAPMTGRVVSAPVAVGSPVSAGQVLLALEAMKMEHAVTAPFDGVLAELHAQPGAQVSAGTELARVQRSTPA